MRRRDLKQIINIIGIIVVCGFGYFYWGMDFVSQEKYSPIKMVPEQKEAYYVENWCQDGEGRREFRLWDGTRVDCLTKDYAIEFDFAHKWAESIGQSLYYSILTKRKPAVVLILNKRTDIIYLKRLEAVAKQVGITVFVINAY